MSLATVCLSWNSDISRRIMVVFATKHELSEGPYQFRFAYTCWSEKQERPYRTP